MKNQGDYPRLKQLNIPILASMHGTQYVTRLAIYDALKTKELHDKFFELFGTQTCPAAGYYPWDVEAVLERMASGNLTGSQALWD